MPPQIPGWSIRLLVSQLTQSIHLSITLLLISMKIYVFYQIKAKESREQSHTISSSYNRSIKHVNASLALWALFGISSLEFPASGVGICSLYLSNLISSDAAWMMPTTGAAATPKRKGHHCPVSLRPSVTVTSNGDSKESLCK